MINKTILNLFFAGIILCHIADTNNNDSSPLTIEQLEKGLHNSQQSTDTNSTEEKSLSMLYNKVRGDNTWDTEVSPADKQTLLTIVTQGAGGITLIHNALIAYWSAKLKNEPFSTDSLTQFAPLIHQLEININFDDTLYTKLEQLVK